MSPGLFREFRRLSSDCCLVHVCGLWSLPGWCVRLHMGLPYIISLHGMLMPWALSRHGVRKRLALALWEGKKVAGARAIICSSQLELRNLDGIRVGNGRLSERGRVVSNVVDLPARVPRPQDFRARWQLQDKLVVLFAARIVENKGLHVSIPAFARVAQAYPDVRMVVVGPDEDGSGARAQRQAAELGIGDRVVFTGLLTGNDYYDAAACADVFLLNSYSENFGMSAAEALALGVPVLVSDQVGIANLVEASGAGCVVSGDTDRVVDALSFMLSDRERLKAMGEEGRGLADREFSRAAVGRRFADLVESVVKGTAGPGRQTPGRGVAS
jgi:glycosyltransferase involved in cell wall biosynthesis